MEHTEITKEIILGFGNSVIYRYAPNKKRIYSITFKHLVGDRESSKEETITWYSTSKDLAEWIKKLGEELEI